MNGIFQVKEDFSEILHDFSRSIIYHKPKDILDFSVKYFYSLEKKIPLSTILETEINTEMTTKTEQNVNQIETVNSTIKQPHEDFTKDNNNITTNKNSNSNSEILKKDDSKNITSENNNEESEEESKSDEESELSDINIYMSKEMAEVIKKNRKKQEGQQEKKSEISEEDRPISGVSGVSGTDSQKQGVKNFIDDLIFES